MVGEEGEPVDMQLLLEAVQLHASVVVDIEVALLGHGKQHLIVQISEKDHGRGGKEGRGCKRGRGEERERGEEHCTRWLTGLTEHLELFLGHEIHTPTACLSSPWWQCDLWTLQSAGTCG